MKKIRNWLVVFLLVPCMVVLAACGGSGNKKPKDPDDGGNPGGSDWFATVAAEIRGTKLAPEFDDIMPGVLVGGKVDASPTSSASSSFGRASFLTLSAEPIISQPCLEHSILNCAECMPQPDEACLWHGRLNCEECENVESTTISSDELASSTRNNDIEWVMESFEDRCMGEGSMSWLYIEMFLNSGLTEKGVWQEVGDAFIDWYINDAMAYMFESMSESVPDQEMIQDIIDTLIRMTSAGVYFKYEEADNDKTFYADIPFAGVKMTLSLKGDGAIEMLMSENLVCTPNNRCHATECSGDESRTSLSYMYYHNNELLSVDYYTATEEGRTYENIGYWEFKKEGTQSTGKAVDMYTSDTHRNVEARSIQGDNESITMLTYYESENDSKFGHTSDKYSSYTITTLIDGVVMTFGEDDAGEITNLYFDAKAFKNLGDITYSRIEHQERNLQHVDSCAANEFTWDSACSRNCGEKPENVVTQIQHDYKCGYYTGNWEDLCNNDNCEEIEVSFHPASCGWNWDHSNNYECTLGCSWTYTNHVYDYDNPANSCRLATGDWTWDDLCDMQCTASQTWIHHERNTEDDCCEVYTKHRDDFCNRDCSDNDENWNTYTWSEVRLTDIEGMDSSYYNCFTLQNKYEYAKVIDGTTEYWSWVPSKTEVYAYFEIGSWGHQGGSLGQITDLEDYMRDMGGLEIDEAFVAAFDTNRGNIKIFFDTFYIDGLDSSLESEQLVLENYDLFKTAIIDFILSFAASGSAA